MACPRHRGLKQNLQYWQELEGRHTLLQLQILKRLALRLALLFLRLQGQNNIEIDHVILVVKLECLLRLPRLKTQKI